jgi:hypothetical protein
VTSLAGQIDMPTAVRFSGPREEQCPKEQRWDIPPAGDPWPV